MLSPQDWVWDAFSLYDSLYSFMHPFILRMNTNSRIFYAEPSKWKRLIWCLSIIFNVGFLLWGSSLYVVVKWNRNPQSVKIVQAAAAIALLVLGVLVLYTCFAHYRFREVHALGLNSLLQLHIVKIESRNKTRKRTPKGMKPERDLKQVVLGKTMMGMVWGFWFIPVIVPIAIFEGIDPFKVVFLDMIPYQWLDKYPLHVALSLFLARLVVTTMIALEVGRFLAIFFLLFISGIIIYIDYIDKFVLQRAQSSAPLKPESFEDFQNVRIIIQILTQILRREICCLMFTGFVIAVGCSIAVLQCYAIFPWYMYYAFVFALVITLIIIYCTLPFGTDSYEKTAQALEECRTQLRRSPPHHRKLLRRIMRSLKPIPVRCGPFFILQRETKSTYFDSILSTSCDLNISVDFKAIFKNGFK